MNEDEDEELDTTVGILARKSLPRKPGSPSDPGSTLTAAVPYSKRNASSHGHTEPNSH